MGDYATLDDAALAAALAIAATGDARVMEWMTFIVRGDNGRYYLLPGIVRGNRLNAGEGNLQALQFFISIGYDIVGAVHSHPSLRGYFLSGEMPNTMAFDDLRFSAAVAGLGRRFSNYGIMADGNLLVDRVGPRAPKRERFSEIIGNIYFDNRDPYEFAGWSPNSPGRRLGFPTPRGGGRWPAVASGGVRGPRHGLPDALVPQGPPQYGITGSDQPSRGELPGQDREPRPEKGPSESQSGPDALPEPAPNPQDPKPETSSPAPTPTETAKPPVLNPPSTTTPKPKEGEDIDQAKDATLAPPETSAPAPKPEPKPKEEPEKKEEEDINAYQNTTRDNPQEDGGDERPYKRVFIPTATDKFLLIAALRAAQEVNKRTPKPGTDTGWQPFGSGSVARAPEQSSGSYLPDAAAGQMMMASSYEGAGRSRFRSPATDGPDQVPLGAARQRDRSNGRGVMSWFRPNPDDPNPSPRPNARARQG